MCDIIYDIFVKLIINYLAHIFPDILGFKAANIDPNDCVWQSNVRALELIQI